MKSSPRFALAGFAAAAAVIWGDTRALAQTAPIEQLDAALITSMKLGAKAGFKARADAVTPAVDSAYDLPGILQVIVGPKWTSLPPAQQADLLAAFRAFTIASYAANFDGYDGQTIRIVPPTRPVGADQVVETNIVGKDGHVDRIDYQMRQISGAWKIEDVLLDGTISNVAVQRSDFRRLLEAGNAQALIDSLKMRASDLANGTAQ